MSYEGQSTYARKMKWLAKEHGTIRLPKPKGPDGTKRTGKPQRTRPAGFGFEHPNKPWKS